MRDVPLSRSSSSWEDRKLRERLTPGQGSTMTVSHTSPSFAQPWCPHRLAFSPHFVEACTANVGSSGPDTDLTVHSVSCRSTALYVTLGMCTVPSFAAIYRRTTNYTKIASYFELHPWCLGRSRLKSIKRKMLGETVSSETRQNDDGSNERQVEYSRQTEKQQGGYRYYSFTTELDKRTKRTLTTTLSVISLCLLVPAYSWPMGPCPKKKGRVAFESGYYR
jgi:hypothetical protein